MCLLEAKMNRDLQNETYDIKKERYLKSGYLTTRAIAEHFDQWDEQAVESRQRSIAEVAPSI